MHPFLCRLLEKPVCAILDGCNDTFVKLNDIVASFFDPPKPTYSLLLINRVKNKNLNAKPVPPPKPPRGILRKKFGAAESLSTCYDHDHSYRNQVDSRTNTGQRKLSGIRKTIKRLSNKPKWFLIVSNIAHTLIQVGKMLSSGAELNIKNDTDLYDSPVLVPKPSDQHRYLLRLAGIYPYPLLIDEKKDDGYILIDDDNDDIEYYP
ncbi:hypothetical protein BJV82DRAFT_582400 [Fennellomyces sp. T-0311]|nr:hypothetical protein BJV82DRAFT_582400 [Fennellomyces sp. T-0311]